MPYPAAAIANEFMKLAGPSGQPLTPMKLQKLVYFAHGWFLALFGRPLVNEPVQAWKFGPVIPSLYHALKVYGNDPVRSRMRDADFHFPADEPGIAHEYSIDDGFNANENGIARELIRKVWEVYGGFSAIQLSNLTHEPGSPWYETPERDKKRCVVIDAERIRSYFKAQAERNKQHAAV